MKKTNFIWTVLALFIFSFSSCKKDEDPTVESHLDTYFSIQNATLVKKEFPSASSSGEKPVIDYLSGNHSVIPGGTNPIDVNTNTDVKNIFIGVENEGGYYKLPVTASKAAYSFYLMLSQDLDKESFVILVSVEDAEGLVSEYKSIPVNLIQAGTGKLQVSCSWNRLNDVDLHLVEPGGAEIYYGNSTSANGGELDVDSNAGCSIDEINNENITYADDDVVQTGEYIVRVDLFDSCDITDDTNYLVTAYYNGAIIATSSGTNPYSGTFHPNDADLGDIGSGVEVMRFTVNDSKSTKLLHFNFENKHPKVLSPQKM